MVMGEPKWLRASYLAAVLSASKERPLHDGAPCFKLSYYMYSLQVEGGHTLYEKASMYVTLGGKR